MEVNLVLLIIQTSPSTDVVTPNNDVTDPPDKEEIVLSPNKTEDSCCYVRWWMVYIAWTLSILAILASTVITVFYGIQFGNETTKKWFTSVTVAFCTGVLITQPLQVSQYAIPCCYVSFTTRFLF